MCTGVLQNAMNPQMRLFCMRLLVLDIKLLGSLHGFNDEVQMRGVTTGMATSTRRVCQRTRLFCMRLLVLDVKLLGSLIGFND